MKEIVIISGKGGTGKTSLTAAFATLTSQTASAVCADADVDAADLHLILNPKIINSHQFHSGHEAVINPDVCTLCGKCQAVCRFDAIQFTTESGYHIETHNCEGCSVCVRMCPRHAIQFPDRLCGEWYESSTRFGPLFHARLAPRAENSGKLVSVVRKAAKAKAEAIEADFILVDGPPGVGCAVIASITGADAVVAVTEPSLSGQHDLLRVAKLVQHFKIPLYVVINKWDINPDLTAALQREAHQQGMTVLGNIAFDPSITMAQFAGKSIIEFTQNHIAKEIELIWKTLYQAVL